MNFNKILHDNSERSNLYKELNNLDFFNEADKAVIKDGTQFNIDSIKLISYKSYFTNKYSYILEDNQLSKFEASMFVDNIIIEIQKYFKVLYKCHYGWRPKDYDLQPHSLYKEFNNTRKEKAIIDFYHAINLGLLLIDTNYFKFEDIALQGTYGEFCSIKMIKYKDTGNRTIWKRDDKHEKIYKMYDKFTRFLVLQYKEILFSILPIMNNHLISKKASHIQEMIDIGLLNDDGKTVIGKIDNIITFLNGKIEIDSNYIHENFIQGKGRFKGKPWAKKYIQNRIGHLTSP